MHVAILMLGCGLLNCPQWLRIMVEAGRPRLVLVTTKFHSLPLKPNQLFLLHLEFKDRAYPPALISSKNKNKAFPVLPFSPAVCGSMNTLTPSCNFSTSVMKAELSLPSI